MLPVPSEGGDFSTLWRLCIESPSQPKLASSLHNKRLSYWRLTGYGRNDGDGGRLFYNLRPLKGKRLTTFCASLALLHPLLSLTHWIFRSLTLPYKSSSHSAKCVCCASLRSGGRRLAVRIAMGCQIGALPCAPFASSRRSPQGETRSMERKNRESYISCTISAFSPFGGERSEPITRMLIKPYDTVR